MTNKLIYPLIATLLLTGAACRGDRKSTASQQQFETVQEGSAAGVTSTIQGPGETIPPMTGTNADTTTSFALNPNVAPGQPAGGTIAGTMPAQPAYPSAVPTGTYLPQPIPAQRQPIVIQRSTPRPVEQQPQQPVEPVPAQPTETVAEPAPPPSQTDTTMTQTVPPPTQTAPPPQQQEKPKKDQQQKPPEDEQEEQTDTAEPPPPPPPPPAG